MQMMEQLGQHGWTITAETMGLGVHCYVRLTEVNDMKVIAIVDFITLTISDTLTGWWFNVFNLLWYCQMVGWFNHQLGVVQPPTNLGFWEYFSAIHHPKLRATQCDCWRLVPKLIRAGLSRNSKLGSVGLIPTMPWSHKVGVDTLRRSMHSMKDPGRLFWQYVFRKSVCVSH